MAAPCASGRQEVHTAEMAHTIGSLIVRMCQLLHRCGPGTAGGCELPQLRLQQLCIPGVCNIECTIQIGMLLVTGLDEGLCYILSVHRVIVHAFGWAGLGQDLVGVSLADAAANQNYQCYAPQCDHVKCANVLRST